MSLKENFRRNLSKLTANGTREEAAKRIKISRITVWKIINGHMEPSIGLIDKIAKAAKINPPEKIFSDSL